MGHRGKAASAEKDRIYENPQENRKAGPSCERPALVLMVREPGKTVEARLLFLAERGGDAVKNLFGNDRH